MLRCLLHAAPAATPIGRRARCAAAVLTCGLLTCLHGARLADARFVTTVVRDSCDTGACVRKYISEYMRLDTLVYEVVRNPLFYVEEVRPQQLLHSLVCAYDTCRMVFVGHIESIHTVSAPLRVRDEYTQEMLNAVAHNADSLVVRVDTVLKGSPGSVFSVISPGCIHCDPHKPHNYERILGMRFLCLTNRLDRAADLGVTPPVAFSCDTLGWSILVQSAFGNFLRGDTIRSAELLQTVTIRELLQAVGCTERPGAQAPPPGRGYIMLHRDFVPRRWMCPEQ